MSISQFSIANGQNLSLGRGSLFIDRFAPGTSNKQGAKPVGNVTTLEINPTTQTKEKRGSVDNTNPLLARVETERTNTISIVGGERLKENIALALLGDTGEYTQAATPVTGEVLTTSSKAGFVYWAGGASGIKRKLTAVAVKVAAATKVLDTDYNLDAETGAVYIIPGGGIADASTVTIDYTPTAIVSGSGIKQVTLATAGTILAELRFVGLPMNGPQEELIIWRVQLLPNGALGFITEDFADYQIQGTILSDAANHPTSPFGLYLQR